VVRPAIHPMNATQACSAALTHFCAWTMILKVPGVFRVISGHENNKKRKLKVRLFAIKNVIRLQTVLQTYFVTQTGPSAWI
jgi:hypothetical protein